MMKKPPQTQQTELGNAAPILARSVTQALAAQRMCEFLDSLPREPVDPSAPLLTQKDINALVDRIEKDE